MTLIKPLETEKQPVLTYSGLEFDLVKEQVSRYASFKLGRQAVLDSQPQFNKLLVSRQLAQLQQALDLTNRFGPLPFGGIFDITEAVDNASRDLTLTPSELTNIASQSYGIRQIKNYMSQLESQTDPISDLCSALDECQIPARSIERCIDASGQLYDNASPKLASLRRQIKALSAGINTKLRHFMSVNNACLQDDIIAQRNGRAVVLVKNSYKNTIGGLQYGSSLSGAATYIEPAEMVESNNELANAQEEQRQEIQRILFMLSQMVKEHAVAYLANLQTLALLDCLFAKAQWGRDQNAVVGKISSDYNLSITEGRHPLIEASRVVANSYHIIKPVTTVLITGPNTGGKTVSLKLIGLFVLLQLSGFPLPATEAIIPVYDQLFYDIGDEQSIQENLSTFSSHITKLAQIINLATHHSLVLLDELGSGTDPAEGQALASAVLDYFRQQHIYLVATTHYGKLKTYAHQFDDVLLASVEFDTNDLKPTYRYLEGVVGQSNAFDIALRCGFNSQVIAQARQFKKEQQTVSEELTEKLQAQLAENRQLQDRLTAQNNELELQKAHLQHLQQQLVADQDKVLDQARQQAAELIADAQQKADEIVEELKGQERYRQKDVAELQKQLEEIIPEPPKRTNEPLKIGDWVKLAGGNQSGQIMELEKKQAIIDCHGVRMKTSIDSLVKTQAPQVTVSNPIVYRRSSASFSSEINLIGQHVEDGLALMDKYLDDAVVARAPFVRIIHGMGSGVLRQAVWDKLKTYKFVDHYEMAPANQGGAGATLVYFKGYSQ